MGSKAKHVEWKVNSDNLELIPCEICESSDHKILTKESGLNIVKCRQCGLVFVNPRPNTEELQNFYSQYFSKDENMEEIENTAKIWQRAMSKMFANDLERINTYFPNLNPSDLKALDVGCGFGFFTKILKENGWQATGCDLSESALKYGREKLHLDLTLGDLQEIPYAKESFDVITAWFLLEHVQHPVKILGRAYELLKPGGIIAVRVPNFGFFKLFILLKKINWFPFVKTFVRAMRKETSEEHTLFHAVGAPEHLYGHTSRSLKKMYEKAGFVNITTYSDSMVTRGNFFNHVMDFLFSNGTKFIRGLTGGLCDPSIVISTYGRKPEK